METSKCFKVSYVNNALIFLKFYTKGKISLRTEAIF